MSARVIVLLLLAVCGLAAIGLVTRTERPPTEPTYATARVAKPAISPAAVGRVFAPDLPLPEGASRRFGGTRFRIPARIESFALSPDGKYVALGGNDNTITVWNAETGVQLYTAGRSSAFHRLSAIAFAGDSLVYASGAAPITVVSTKDWAVKRELDTCEKNWVQAIVASPDGTRLAITCETIGEVRLQALDGSPPIGIPDVKRPELLAWSADGAWIAATSSATDRVLLIDVARGRVAKELPESETDAIAFSPRGAVLAYEDSQSYTNEKVRLYDVAADKEIGAYDVALGTNAIAFSPDGMTLAYGQDSDTRSLAIVNLATGMRREMMRPKQTIKALAFAGKHLWIGVEQSVRLWDIVADAEVAGPAGHRGAVLSLAYRPDGRSLASGSEDATVRIWDLATATSRELALITDEYGVIVIDKLEDWMKSPMSPVIGLAWSHDGARLYSAEGGVGRGIVHRWTAAGAIELARPLHDIHLHRFAVAPDESVVYATGATQEGTDFRTVRIADGMVARKIEGADEDVLAMSPDGRTLAIGREDGLQIVDTRTGEVKASGLPGGTWMAFSHDNTQLAIAHGAVVSTYRVGKPDPITENFATMDGSVESIAFTPDGRLVLGTNRGEVVVVRPGKDDERIVREHAHRGTVRAVAVAPDGKTFASGADDGEILIWPL